MCMSSRLGEQETPRAGALSYQPVVRLDTGHGQGEYAAANLAAEAESRSSDWIQAMDKAVNMQFPNGIDRSDPYLLIPSIVSDNGCQPTSKAFAEYEKNLWFEHDFASYCNPKGNADTERVIRTIGEDLLWISEFNTLDELKEALGK